MRDFLLLVFLMTVHLLSAQSDVHFSKQLKLDTSDAQTAHHLSNENFRESMDLTDSAVVGIFFSNGDTAWGTMRYSQSKTLEKMQSFLYVEYARDSAKVYSPAQLKGYCAIFGRDSALFISMDNSLEIISVLSGDRHFDPVPGAAPFRKEKTIVTGAGKIFMNCLIYGSSKLFRYITAQNEIKTGPVIAMLYFNDASPESSGFKYCIQKDNNNPVQLSHENLSGFFYDSMTAQEYINHHARISVAELKELFALYNRWKAEATAPPGRY